MAQQDPTTISRLPYHPPPVSRGGRLAFQRRANATAQIEAEEAMQAHRAQQMVSWLRLDYVCSEKEARHQGTDRVHEQACCAYGRQSKGFLFITLVGRMRRGKNGSVASLHVFTASPTYVALWSLVCVLHSDHFDV